MGASVRHSSADDCTSPLKYMFGSSYNGLMMQAHDDRSHLRSLSNNPENIISLDMPCTSQAIEHAVSRQHSTCTRKRTVLWPTCLGIMSALGGLMSLKSGQPVFSLL